MKMLTKKPLVMILISIFIITTASLVVFQLFTSKSHEQRLSQQQIIQEAKAHFKIMLDTRSWNANFGGVYVKATVGLKPNLYLKHNLLYTDKNETLIKINPAWMTRQIFAISNKQSSYQYKITSLKPLNPSNKADVFESQALNYFEKNLEEKFFYDFNTKMKRFDFMGILLTEKSCLRCHGQQGYKVGDVRGGIRVSIPLKLHYQQMKFLDDKTHSSALIVVFVSIVLLGLFYWVISMFFKRQDEIEHANEILEETVSARTHDLEVVLSHEEHLKDLLQIITEVNEMLIISYSTRTILKNATDKLATNKAYSLVLTGLINENVLEVVSQSAEDKRVVPHTIISLDKEDEQNCLSAAIAKARTLKQSIIEKIPQASVNSEYQRRESDLDLKWFIVLPLIEDFEKGVYGVIVVFCPKEEGLEAEEMKILENMAYDISIALYSHKQRDSILAMEKEKSANYEETILAFVNIIEQRDSYTAGHTIRVAEYCALIAKEMGYSEDDIRLLTKAAILHDIGKVATPDAILLKPGKLSHLEYELIKQHSAVGADMLEKISIYKDLAQIIRYHHARYDGKGYPRTTNPDEIPMLSHIMIVADAFDAMTTNRIYRPRKNIAEALEELMELSGIQFHPEVVSVAMLALKDLQISITTQMPTSKLEEKRMSYFFQDPLTGLFNEDYLQVTLNGNEDIYRSLNVVNLQKFTKYNQDNGWQIGNMFLQNMANLLEKIYPESLIVRYHGDDFILLHKTEEVLDLSKIIESDLIKKSSITLDITHYDIDRYFTFNEFQKREDGSQLTRKDDS